MNRIICADSRRMNDVQDESVHLVVTSPPYNVGKKYDQHCDAMPVAEYMQMLRDVFGECQRVVVDGGRLCVNVANTGRKPYVPLAARISVMLEQDGWIPLGEIIWDRGPSAGVSTAWGSFGSSKAPILRDVHEYILVFAKGRLDLPDGGQTGITGGAFASWTRSVWRPEQRLGVAERKALEKIRYAKEKGKNDLWVAEQIARAIDGMYQEASETVWPMQTKGSKDHPAPFPEELPRRLILLYTKPGDVVLDPFMGVGSTAVAAAREGRQYIGYDVSEAYCQIARWRVNGESQSISLTVAAKQFLST